MANLNKIRADYEEGMSIPEIAEKFMISRSTARNNIILSGAKLRSRADGIRIAAIKGRMTGGKTLRGRKKSRTHIENMKKAFRKRLLTAKGKRIHKQTGYVVITIGENVGRSEHVVTMEKQIGRRIRKNEVVHHIDGNRTNNHVSNLSLMTRNEHTRLHRSNLCQI
jgi:hypothetical protein